MIICPKCQTSYGNHAEYCNVCNNDLPKDAIAQATDIENNSDICFVEDIGLPMKTAINLSDFSSYYLLELKKNLGRFRTFFSFLGLLFAFSLLTSIVFSINFFIKGEFPNGLAMLQIATVIFQAMVIIWFALLSKTFIRLQTEKVENDIFNTIKYRERSEKMAKELLEAAETNAGNKITINGDNAVFAFDGGSVSGVTQTKTVEGDGELLQALALLVSYSELQDNNSAVELSKELTEEATKPTPDKGKVFELWNSITMALPQVSGIVKIADEIKKLFVG